MNTDWRERLAVVGRWSVRIGLPLLLLVGVVFFARFYGAFYPIQEWLFWRYAGYWLAVAVWAAGCASSGYALLRRLGPPLPLLETVVMSFATGVVLFYLAVNLVGQVGALRWPMFFVLPLAMIAAGATPSWRSLRRYLRHVRPRRAKRRARPALETVAWVFGLAVLAMVYFSMLTPENAQFDARWKHLALAEQYAHVGRIPRFGEGWTVATNPHMASVLYTWAFLIPGKHIFDQVELAAHMELVCFLFSIAGIPALVRRLVPGVRAHHAWVARFLFPGILLYDSSLSAGADHIAALFAAPVFLALLRAWRDLDPRRCALVGLMFAGAAMPKLTSAILLIPVPAVAIGVVAVVRALRRGERRRLEWRGPLVGLAAALIATSPFWLRNWIWYGDPMYPSLHRYLTLRPWTEDAAVMFEAGYKDYQFWRPERSLDGLLDTLKALFTFSFIPNDYPKFHGKMPVFGSLFTLLLPCLLFFRKTKRIWALVGAVHGGLFAWYWVHHQDRYLQTMVPWMAAVVAAILILVWRTHIVARIAASLLIAAQIVIGADAYFIPSHAMIQSPTKVVVDLLGAGYKKQYAQRLQVFKGWVEVREALPPKAYVMLHDNHVHLGLSRRTASDWGGWQFGLSYGRLVTPRRVWDAYRQIGVTHLVWQESVSKGWDSLGGDLVFFDFALRHTVDRKRVGSMWIARMPDQPPPDEVGAVAVFGCGNYYKNGLYRLADLTTPVFGPDRAKFAAPIEHGRADDELIAQADYVVVDSTCAKAVEGKLSSQFQLAAKRKIINTLRGRRGGSSWQLYVRR